MGRRAISMAAGCEHTCGVLENRSLVCWGKNSYGQLGDDIEGELLRPVVVDFGVGQSVVGVELGCEHTCAVFEDGSRVCRGEMSFENKVRSSHGCKIGLGGVVVCEGYNGRGQLGIRTPHRGDEPGEMGEHLSTISVD